MTRIKKPRVKKPADMIISQIKGLIASGAFTAGDRLPAERVLAEQFGIGRGHVREALKHMEWDGLLETRPQSGTYVRQPEGKGLAGAISQVFDPGAGDPDSLLELRRLLEVDAARLAASKASTKDIIELIRCHENHRRQVRAQTDAISRDHQFHDQIIRCAKNTPLKTLMDSISSDILNAGSGPDPVQADEILKEHEAILQAIKQRNPDQAATAMTIHMKNTLMRMEKDR